MAVDLDHASPCSAGPRGFTVGSLALACVGPLIIVALCWLRSPQMLTEGRFWAEDSMFYGNATHSATFLQKAFYIYKGHIEVFTSVSHALASYLNPKMAPLLTGSAALLLECTLGFMLVAFRKELALEFLPVLALCALLVVSPVASESYLNALNSQWLAAAILVVLVNLPREVLDRRKAIVCLASLALGLCGIESCLIFPIALLYTVGRRSGPHAIIASTLLVCCLIQAAMIATHPIDSRFQPIGPTVYIVAPFLQIVVKHLLGMGADIALADGYRHGAIGGGALTSFIVLPTAMLAFLAVLVFRKRERDLRLLLVSLVTLTCLNEIGAVGDRNELVGPFMMRYFFVPSLMAGMLLARSTASSHALPLRQGVLYVVLVVSAADFFGNGYNDSLVTLRHSWRNDVDECRQHQDACHIGISPDGFEVVLPPRIP